jgi:hypothetical protein
LTDRSGHGHGHVHDRWILVKLLTDGQKVDR